MAEKRTHPATLARRKRKAISVEARQREAYRLWFDEKKPLREVGSILGVSHEQARIDIQATIDHVVDEFDEEIRSLRAKQLRRLLTQYDRFDKIAEDEERTASERTKAGHLCLGILKEINDVLGVKAATKLDVSLGVNWSDLARDATPNQTDADQH